MIDYEYNYVAMIRILGIDPGYGRVGWGVIEKRRNGFFHIAHGCIETSAKASFSQRLHHIHEVLLKIVERFEPSHAGVEELFFCKNVTTAIKVGQARGVILLTLEQQGLKVSEFTPLQIKQAVTGYGKAEKKQVQKMVQVQLNMKGRVTQDDAADALGVALVAGLVSRTKAS